MQRKTIAVFGILLITIFLLTVSVGAAMPDSGQNHDASSESVKKLDNKPHPLGEEQAALKAEAMDAVLNGKAYGKTHEVARGQFVELAREGEDLIWTITAEFSDFPHNNIDEPDRSVDNTTHWQEDFSQAYYEEILFSDEPGANSMRNFYIENSSNRYTVDGDVTDWVPLPGTAASYDDDAGALALWMILEDSGDGWYAQMLSEGMTPDQINDYLSQFDVWDRYDYNGNGDFNEPDGYIDHFQSVHAGEGEEAGGGALGGAAIWSHRWYARFHLIGAAGPAGNLSGGVQVGESDYWIGDYTIEPENGGVGVFAHEFAHDLGLPDLYNTAGGPENSTGFWTLMSSGSWLGDGTVDIGTMPGHFGGWEKFQLGWLNYEVAFAGERSSHKLGPSEANTKQAQGLFVVLPPKEVTEVIAVPYAGDYFYYSGAGNDLDNVMYKAYDLPAGSSLTAMVNYEIEIDWDYAYVVVSTDDGATWQGVPTNHSDDPLDNVNGQNFGNGISGNSGGWAPLTADLSAYTGPVMLGFRYWTDVAAVEPGFMIDEIMVNGDPVPADGAEEDAGWTFEGFRVTTGTESGYYNNYYLAELKVYRGYDANLEVGPYNFGFLDVAGNWVEHFPYQNGVLISYWDTSQENNNTATHPGEGLILPIDAHPDTMYDANGSVWRNRIQTYDATFGTEATDAIMLHTNSQPSEHASQPAVRVFDDNIQYWNAENPTGGVMNPHTGTQIVVKSFSAHDNFAQILVRQSKSSNAGMYTP